jgi:hypothetical protein
MLVDLELISSSGMSFHQGTATGTLSNPEASTIGR